MLWVASDLYFVCFFGSFKASSAIVTTFKASLAIVATFKAIDTFYSSVLSKDHILLWVSSIWKKVLSELSLLAFGLETLPCVSWFMFLSTSFSLGYLFWWGKIISWLLNQAQEDMWTSILIVKSTLARRVQELWLGYYVDLELQGICVWGPNTNFVCQISEVMSQSSSCELWSSLANHYVRIGADIMVDCHQLY